MKYEGDERRNNYMNSEIMSTLTEIKVAIGRIEERQDNQIELITHNRQIVKDHIEKDDVSLRAIGIELTNIDQKIDRKHSQVMSMILPVFGGFSVIMFLLNWFHK